MELIIKYRNTNTNLYFELCEENWSAYIKSKNELMKKYGFYKANPDLQRMLNAYNNSKLLRASEEYSKTRQHRQFFDMLEKSEKVEKKRMSSVIFAVCCLENFIYDYIKAPLKEEAPLKKRDPLKKRIAKKLKGAEKFIFHFINQITFVTDIDFSLEDKLYKNLKALVEERHKLIHFKSERLTNIFDFIEKNMLSKNNKQKQKTEEISSLDVVIEVLQEVKKLEAEMPEEDRLKILKWELIED